jgi:hypothetical protein
MPDIFTISAITCAVFFFIIVVLVFTKIIIKIYNILFKKEEIDIELFYEVQNDELIIKYNKTWHGERRFSISTASLCQHFRNGQGYEYIDRILKELKATGGITEKEINVMREFMRCWGHNHEQEN